MELFKIIQKLRNEKIEFKKNIIDMKEKINR